MPNTLMFYALVALPLALLWVFVTARVTLDSFLVGYAIGFLIMLVGRTKPFTVQIGKLPAQVVAFVVYTVVLARDIWRSSLDVAVRALSPDTRINSGIIAVPTQDEGKDNVITALSAHSITITPGQLVVDFDQGNIMYVHCLDIEANLKTIHAEQTTRLRLLRRVLGKSEDQLK